MPLTLFPKLVSMFRMRYVEGKPDECWNWYGDKYKEGYGRIRIDGTGYRSSRISYLYYNKLESLDDNLHVLHTCDNPRCVNPNHLKLGDQQSNMEDRNAKDRQARGTVNGQAKINNQLAAEIRSKSKDGQSRNALSREYGISRRQIVRIINGENW
jgi:hypothetical protein